MDLLDRDAVLALPATVLAEWGRIDVLFNNAIYQGVGTLDRVVDLTPESMLDMFTGNFVHQVLLIQAVLPHMIERGSGTIIDMVSGSARLDPPAPPGEGGWGILYSGSKAAFARVAGGIERRVPALGDQGVQRRPRQRGHRSAQGDPAGRRVRGRVRQRTGRGHREGRGVARDRSRCRPLPRQVDLRPEAVLRSRPAPRLDVRTRRRP